MFYIQKILKKDTTYLAINIVVKNHIYQYVLKLGQRARVDVLGFLVTYSERVQILNPPLIVGKKLIRRSLLHKKGQFVQLL